MQVALGLDSILSRKKKLSKKGFEKMDTYTLDQNVQKVLLGNFLCYCGKNFSAIGFRTIFRYFLKDLETEYFELLVQNV